MYEAGALEGDGSLQKRVADLGLLDASGPHPVEAPKPSPEAIDRAYSLAQLSLAPLRNAINAGGGRVSLLGGEWWLAAPPTDQLPEETTLGIPLLAACSPEAIPAERNAVDHAVRWLVAHQEAGFIQARYDFSARLTRLLVVEHTLWELAEANGGPSARIPYAFRFRALSWFWTPEAHAPGLDASAICIRCGALIPPTRKGRPRKTSPPRCAACANEPPKARGWPERAIAPDGQGTWWLTCAGCGGLFVGRRQARRCPQCRPSATTPSRRGA